MKHRGRHPWSLIAGLSLTAALLMGGSTVLAQSPDASPSHICTPLAAQAPAASGAQSPATPLPSLTIFAAASLNKPFAVMGQSWAAQHPGSELTFSFDASSALRAQIEEGAPVDVFASADLRNPQTLVDECLAPAPVTVFATNHLVIVVPTDNPAGIDSPDDLATAGVRIVAAGDEVPITGYAEQVIANLAGQPGTAAGYADAVHANIVSREDNVAAVLAKIALGEGDAGIVYVSDAASAAGVTAIEIPEAANVLAEYGAVQVASTGAPGGAAAFLLYLTGSEAQAILAQFGFLPPQ